MKFLIVNADDFGLDKNINSAVESAHVNGILTSASVMAGGDAFEDAVEIARRRPALGIGVHTALVGGLLPTAPAAEVPSLLDESGFLFDSYTEFLRRDLEGRIDYGEVYLELDAQFAKIIATGLHISHADGHQHLHIWPRILPLVVTLCKKYDIPCLRIPAESIRYGKHLVHWKRFLGKTGLTILAERARRYIATEGMKTTDHFWGMMDGGALTERTLLGILNKLPSGFNELMCHPGSDDRALAARFPWHYHWESELAALISPRVYETLIGSGIHRLNYGAIRP